MTNDLSMQPVIQQDRKNPYVSAGIGMGAGALAGVGGAYVYDRIKKPDVTYEDLIKEVEGKDKVELTSKKEALDKAEKELADASKPVYEGTEKEALEKAIEKRDAELRRLTETKPTTTTVKGGEIVERSADWAMTDAQRNAYDDLYEKYKAGKTALEGDATYKNLSTQLENRKNNVTEFYKDLISDVDDLIKKTKGYKKPIKSVEDYLVDSKGENTINDLIQNKKMARLTNAELIKLGGGKLIDSRPKVRVANIYVPVILEDGTKKYAEIPKNEYNRAIQKRTQEVADRITNGFKAYYDAQKNLEKLPETIKFDKSLIRNAGLERNPNGEIINFATKLEEFHNDAAKYKNEMKLIENAKQQNFVPDAGKGVTDPKIKDLMQNYGKGSPKEVYEMLSARVGIDRKYTAEKEKLTKIINGAIGKDNLTSELESKINDFKKNFKFEHDSKKISLTYLEAQIRGKFSKFLKTVTHTTSEKALTEAEAMERQSYKDLAKIVEEKQAAYDRVVGEKGKINETVKAAKEEAQKTAKAEYEKVLSELGGKVKALPGRTKALIAAGVGVVGGLIGLGIANSHNKKIDNNYIA